MKIIGILLCILLGGCVSTHKVIEENVSAWGRNAAGGVVCMIHGDSMQMQRPQYKPFPKEVVVTEYRTAAKRFFPNAHSVQYYALWMGTTNVTWTLGTCLSCDLSQTNWVRHKSVQASVGGLPRSTSICQKGKLN